MHHCFQGMATQLAPMLGFPIEGIWHTAVVVHGFEWYFGGGGGIVHSLPGTTELREPLRTVDLGATDINLSQFQGLVIPKPLFHVSLSSIFKKRLEQVSRYI